MRNLRWFADASALLRSPVQLLTELLLAAPIRLAPLDIGEVIVIGRSGQAAAADWSRTAPVLLVVGAAALRSPHLHRRVSMVHYVSDALTATDSASLYKRQ